VPEQVAFLPKEALTYDIHNVFFGAVTLTQPIFMGGKIVAMNKITGYAEELARAKRNNQARDIVYAVDAAYWELVSLKAKQRLAVSYVNLLDTLRHHVDLMVKQGVATAPVQIWLAPSKKIEPQFFSDKELRFFYSAIKFSTMCRAT